MNDNQILAPSERAAHPPPRVLSLHGGSRAPTAARLAVDYLEPALSPANHEDLRLLVTELVANSVRHGGMTHACTIELSLDVRGGVVHAEIGDSGPGFATPVAAEFSRADTGWGLHLLDHLASDWGVKRNGGSRVWFELPAQSGVL